MNRTRKSGHSSISRVNSIERTSLIRIRLLALASPRNTTARPQRFLLPGLALALIPVDVPQAVVQVPGDPRPPGLLRARVHHGRALKSVRGPAVDDRQNVRGQVVEIHLLLQRRQVQRRGRTEQAVVEGAIGLEGFRLLGALHDIHQQILVAGAVGPGHPPDMLRKPIAVGLAFAVQHQHDGLRAGDDAPDPFRQVEGQQARKGMGRGPVRPSAPDAGSALGRREQQSPLELRRAVFIPEMQAVAVHLPAMRLIPPCIRKPAGVLNTLRPST